jgi:hypothetical protein
MAMQNTLSLPELLENIISHLPERDILCHAQRVSRHWKIIIDSSPTIQKKTWLQPVEQSAISPKCFNQDETIMLGEVPIYSRTTLINPLLIGQDTKTNNWREISPDFTVRMKPMGAYGKLTGCSCPNLLMPTPEAYEQIKADQKTGIPCVPSWRKMYLSQPPVTTAMMTIAYFYKAPIDGRYLFQVMVYDKAGITMGLVYDTLAATMPAYDESLEDDKTSGAVTAHVGWSEVDGEFGEKEDSEDSEDDSSDDDSGGYDSDGYDSIEDGDSVAYDSEGNVLGDSSSLIDEPSSGTYEYAEHESELGSDTGYEPEGHEELAESHLQIPV